MVSGNKVLRLAPLIPLGVAIVYFAALSTSLPRLLRAAFLVSDVASIPVLTHEVASNHAGLAVVSIATFYSSFLFNLMTKAWPFHRAIWEALSVVLSLMGVGLLAWSVWRVAGRAAGLLALALGIAVSPTVLMEFLWFRGPTWFTTVLLSFYITVLTKRDLSMKPSLAIGVPIALGVVLGLNVASDPLLGVSGALPFVVAAAASRLGLPPDSKGRLLKAVGLVSASAFVAAGLTFFGMHVMGFRVLRSTPGGPVHFATLANLKFKVSLFAMDIAGFGNGQFKSAVTSPIALGRFMAALATFFALAAPLALFRSYLKDRPSLSSNPPRFAFVVFWATCLIAVSSAFLLSSLPAEGSHSSRYVIPVFFALVALVPLWAGPGPRRLVLVAAATLICSLSLAGLSGLVKLGEANQLHREGSILMQVLDREGLTRGYSSYLHALGLTWLTDMRVGVYPVYECAYQGSPQLCPYPVNKMTGWYRGLLDQRSFLLIGEARPFELTSPAPAILGPPVKVEKAGGFSVYVYDYDIASRLLRTGT